MDIIDIYVKLLVACLLTPAGVFIFFGLGKRRYLLIYSICAVLMLIFTYISAYNDFLRICMYIVGVASAVTLAIICVKRITEYFSDYNNCDSNRSSVKKSDRNCNIYKHNSFVMKKRYTILILCFIVFQIIDKFLAVKGVKIDNIFLQILCSLIAASPLEILLYFLSKDESVKSGYRTLCGDIFWFFLVTLIVITFGNVLQYFNTL